MKKHIGSICLLVHISLFCASYQPPASRRQITVENATNDELNLHIQDETNFTYKQTLPPQTTLPIALEKSKGKIKELYYLATPSWANPQPLRNNIDVSKFIGQTGPIHIKIESGWTGYYDTITEGADVSQKIALSQAPNYLAMLLSEANEFDQATTKLKELLASGYTLASIAKSDPYLLLGFPEPVDINKANEKQKASEVLANYTKFKSLLEQKPSQEQHLAITALQLLRQARSNMLEGTNAEKATLTALGKQLNNLLISNNSSGLQKLKNGMKDQYGENFSEQLLVAALLTYYYKIARELGHTFQEGSFVVYDDTGNIFKFLEGLKGTERRDASHLNSLAKTERYDWLAQTGKNFYGFPVNLSKSEGKGTVLFNRINRDGTSVFIKPESSGLETWTAAAHHALGFGASLGRKYAPAYFGSDDDPPYSKERVPQDIRNAYKELISEAKEKGLPEDTATQMLQYNDYKGMGIQKMLPYAEQLKQYAPEAAQSFVNMINQRAQSDDQITRAKYTHLDKRFGHEAILTKEEFGQPQ